MYDEKIFVGVANVEEDFCVTTTKKIKGTYFEFHFIKGQTIPIYKNNIEQKFLLIGYLDTYEEYFQPMGNFPVKELKTNKINYMLW